jgi:hypothetical protein
MQNGDASILDAASPDASSAVDASLADAQDGSLSDAADGTVSSDSATPVDATPVDATSADASPADATPADATPADATPADATPADATAADATAADATSADATPVDGGPEDAGFGPPIQIPGDAPYDTWTWISMPGSACANGTPTGIGINPHAGSTGLLIWFQGGGDCFTYDGCAGPMPTAQHLGGYGPNEFATEISFRENSGIFERSNTNNPFHDFNMVLFPYCTGDVHTGDRVATYTNGSASITIDHVGFVNIGVFLRRVVPTFASSTLVAVTGSSAGGFGAFFNYGRTHDAFFAMGSPRMILVDDAGSAFRPPYLAVALQQAQRSAWGSPANIPPGCALCDPAVPGGGIHNLWTYYAADPAFRGAFVISERDENPSLRLAQPPGYTPLVCSPTDFTTPCQFPWALSDFDNAVAVPAAPGIVRDFFVSSYLHTWLHRPLDSAETSSVTLAEFLRREVADSPNWQSEIPCNDQGNSFTPSNENPHAGPVPAAAGGSPVPGYYLRMTDTVYNAPLVLVHPYEIVQVISAGANQYTFQRALSTLGGPTIASNFTATTNGTNRMVLAETCPPGNTYHPLYTATSTSITIYEYSAGGPDAGTAPGTRLVTYDLQP